MVMEHSHVQKKMYGIEHRQKVKKNERKEGTIKGKEI
jgi:hypothetical protein